MSPYGPPARSGTNGVNARGLTVADVDQDGIADALVANQAFQTMSLLVGKSDGTLTDGVLVPAPEQVIAIDVADLNQDRRLEMVAVSSLLPQYGVAGRLAGSGAFLLVATGPLPWPAIDMGLADVNGDGHADLVVAANGLPEIAVLPGDGTGTFRAAQRTALPTAASTVTLADVDVDGFADAIVTSRSVGQVVVMRGSAGGLQPRAVSTTPALEGPVAVGDLDGDSIVDLVALTSGAPEVQFLRGNGTGGFSATATLPFTGVPGNSIATGDVDHDGHIDVIVGAGAAILVAVASPSGGFLPPTAFVTDALGVSSVAVHDLTGDGRADLFHVSGTNGVAVASRTTATAPGLAGYGLGTPECGGRIGMWATESPKVGASSFAYTVTNAPPNAFGFLLQGGPADVNGSDPFQLGVLLHLGVGLLSTRLVFTDQFGRSLMREPIPASPGLAGLPVFVQTLWQAQPGRSCSRVPSLLSSSIGLETTIQP